MSLEQLGEISDERNGDHGEERGKEESLRHHPFVLAVLQAQHDAVGGYGHGTQHHGHIGHEVFHSQQAQHHAHYQRQHDEAEQADGVGKAVATCDGKRMVNAEITFAMGDR